MYVMGPQIRKWWVRAGGTLALVALGTLDRGRARPPCWPRRRAGRAGHDAGPVGTASIRSSSSIGRVTAPARR